MDLPTNYHAFIDESGDDGFSKTSTEWLVIAAVILKKEHVHSFPPIWQKCKTAIGRKPHERLHWKNFDHSTKKALLREIDKGTQFSIVVVAAHKPSLTGPEMLRLKCPSLYSYQAKLLVERLSWFARDKGSKIDITFEDRPQVSIKELKEYIFVTLQKPGRNTQTAYECMGGFNAKHVSQQTCLELADCMVSAIANGLNKDRYAAVETSYALTLLPRIWVRGNNLYSYGMKLTPGVDRAQFELFLRIDEERRNKKTPG